MLPEVRPDNARIVQVEQGWGRANACALGAGLAEGDVIHWLDADMLPEPRARRGAAAVAPRDRLRRGARQQVVRRPGAARRRHAGTRCATPWPRTGWRSTSRPTCSSRTTGSSGTTRSFDDLRTIGPRACRIHVGATASLARDLYRESGGMDTTPQARRGHLPGLPARRGGRGVPARPRGTVLAPGPHPRDDPARRGQRLQRLLPVRPPARAAQQAAGRPAVRRARTSRSSSTRRGLLHGSVVATVDSVLESTLPDLQVTLIGPWSDLDDTRIHPLEDPMLDTRLVQASYAGDPRVRLVESLPEGRCPAMFRMTLENADWAPTRKTLARLVHHLERTHHGLRRRADARRHDRAHRADRRRLAVPARHQVRRVPRRRARRAVRRVDLRRGRGRLLAVPRGAPAADAGHGRRGRGPGHRLGLRRRADRPQPRRPSRRPRPARPARPPDLRRPRRDRSLVGALRHRVATLLGRR